MAVVTNAVLQYKNFRLLIVFMGRSLHCLASPRPFAKASLFEAPLTDIMPEDVSNRNPNMSNRLKAETGSRIRCINSYLI